MNQFILADVLSLGPHDVANLSLGERARCTLALAHLRGYALPVARLPSLLLGGPVPREALEDALVDRSRIEVQDGIACIRGNGQLIPATRRRLSTHPGLEARFDRLARAYVRELVDLLPTVECVAVAGSFTSGGLCRDDDLDLNLFVRDKTKFLSYLAALVLAARYGLRTNGWHNWIGGEGGNGGQSGKGWTVGNGGNGGAPGNGAPADAMPLPFITKRICINVIWERAEARPFARKDAALAFELLNSRPVYNAPYFDSVVADNRWLLSYFPQMADRRLPANGTALRENGMAPRARGAPRPSGGRLVPGIIGGMARLGVGEAVSRRAVRFLHALVKNYRAAYPEARSCAARKERLKHPYGLLELPRPVQNGRRE